MAKYLVNEPLNHDQKEFQPGEEVELTDEQAAPLLLVNVVTAANGDAAAAGKVTAAELVVKIKAAATLDEVVALLGDDKRATVLKAAEERTTELNTPKGD
jgi:hypothetical protein